MPPHNGKSISRSLVGTVLSVGAFFFFFFNSIDNSQSATMLRSLQVFMRWEKPWSRWKTTWHLELVGSPLKPSARWRKAHTTAPHSHPGTGEQWRNSIWHRNVAVVSISRQRHQDNWKEKHQLIHFWKLLSGAASLVTAGNKDMYKKCFWCNLSFLVGAFYLLFWLEMSRFQAVQTSEDTHGTVVSSLCSLVSGSFLRQELPHELSCLLGLLDRQHGRCRLS